MPDRPEALSRSDAEVRLDAFDDAVRAGALDELARALEQGDVTAYGPRPVINLHAHTFFSYNPYGFSPSHFAWKAKVEEDLQAAGIVDFDVLDGLEEFLAAGDRLRLKTCVSLESRVFVLEFADREINSPGEPGVAYHMGVGFTQARPGGDASAFLDGMRERAAERNRELVERVNRHTDPVILDVARDVLPLTPRGNATERHLCEAYVRKAAAHFGDDREALAAYWTDRLGTDARGLDLPDGPGLQAAVRSKTMKRGGVGYVQPGEGSFPSMADMNRFVLEAGAVPALTWLDGTSAGEQCIRELMDVSASTGAAALNIIPDRNFTPGVEDEKLHNLYEVVSLAEKRHWPIVVGTEMNSPGQKFVDDFESGELSPLTPVFLKGAHIVYAHSLLQRAGGMGYLSAWADAQFADAAARNEFYKLVGYRAAAGAPRLTEGIRPDWSPARVLDHVTTTGKAV